MKGTLTMDLVPAKVLRCLLLLLCSGVGSLWPGQGWAQGESASMVLLGEAPLIEIEAVQKQMTMGDLLELNVKSNSESVKGCLLLPYVNGLRWGAHAVCTGPSTVLRIPMCEQGPQQVQVMVRAGMWDEQGAFVARSELSCLLAGSPAPKTAQGMWLSKPVTVEVIEPARQGLGGEPSRRVGVVWNPMVGHAHARATDPAPGAGAGVLSAFRPGHDSSAVAVDGAGGFLITW